MVYKSILAISIFVGVGAMKRACPLDVESTFPSEYPPIDTPLQDLVVQGSEGGEVAQARDDEFYEKYVKYGIVNPPDTRRSPWIPSSGLEQESKVWRDEILLNMDLNDIIARCLYTERSCSAQPKKPHHIADGTVGRIFQWDGLESGYILKVTRGSQEEIEGEVKAYERVKNMKHVTRAYGIQIMKLTSEIQPIIEEHFFNGFKETRSTGDDPTHVLFLIQERFDGDGRDFADFLTDIGRKYRQGLREEAIEQLCEGLNEIHRAGFLHGSPLPQNVLWRQERSGKICAKICDLGDMTESPSKSPINFYADLMRFAKVFKTLGFNEGEAKKLMKKYYKGSAPDGVISRGFNVEFVG